MPDKSTNILALLDRSRGGIDIVLGIFKTLNEATVFNSELAKEKFIRNVCIGLNCPAFAVNQLESSGLHCTGPKQDVMSDDNGITISALTELTSYKKPITNNSIKPLKCQPKIFIEY